MLLSSRAGSRSRTRDDGRFRSWRRERPFWGSVLVIVAGIEMFFSGQLDIGKIHLQFGVEGMQGTVLPAVLVVLGILSMLSPAQRIFYGIISLVIAVYSLIGVNLGGFFVGFILGVIGGILVVAWIPRHEVVAEAEAVVADAAAAPPSFEPPQDGAAHAEYVPWDMALPGSRHENP